MLLALPLAFAACDPEPAPEPQPEKEYAAELTLTSDAEMNFAAEGGEGTITYTAKMVEVTRDYMPTVEATCEADWVTINGVAENITFTVAANEAEARETKINVTYADKSFDVVVKQAAKGEEPKEYAMDVELAIAMRGESSDLGYGNDHFILVFLDEEENINVGVILKSAAGETVLQAGNYTTEAENFLYGELEVIDPEIEAELSEGTISVTLEGETYAFDMELTDEEGALYHFTYEGEVLGMNGSAEPEYVTLEPVKVDSYRDVSWELGNFEIGLWIDVNKNLYHAIDMYDKVNPNDKYLSEGRYSTEDGTIGVEYSNIIADVETGEGAHIVDAVLDIEHFEDGTTNICGYIESEYGQILEIDWTGVVVGFDFSTDGPTPEPGDAVEFNATHYLGQYFSDEEYFPGLYNYFVALSDHEITDDKFIDGATYHFFDLYSDEINGDLTIPNGVYTFDPDSTCAPGTFAGEYSYGYTYEDGSIEWYLYAEGSKVTVTDNKIVAELILEDGTKYVVTYEGVLTTTKVEVEDVEIGLSEDLELNLTNCTIIPEYYDQFYSSDTDNWYISIYEDLENGNGAFIILDLLADFATSIDYRGTFTCSDSFGINTFISGYVDEEDYLVGSWYTQIENDVLSTPLAPIVDGSINITMNDDGTQTFVFNCKDVNGYNITGSVTGSVYAGGYALNKSAKKQTKDYRSISPKSLVR